MHCHVVVSEERTFTHSFSARSSDGPDSDEVGSFTFTKEPSIIEQKAYRDTWGLGLDSYLQWLSETAVLLHQLLHEKGSILFTQIAMPRTIQR
jgi:hypothetical protein